MIISISKNLQVAFKQLCKKHKTTTAIFTLVLLISLALFTRTYNYTLFPRLGATFDEFAWTWLGINLIQTAELASWSPHPQYETKEHVTYLGASFWIVRPYLEHPPLFGLVAGGAALLSGARDMYSVTLENMRPLAIALGTASTVLTYLFVNRVYNQKAAVLSASLYATIPTIVIGSRLLQNENFLIPIWLTTLFLIHKYLKTGSQKYFTITAILAGLITLAKVPWFVVPVSLAMILSLHRKWKDAIILFAASITIFSIYIFYALYLDNKLFLSLLALQTARYDISFSGVLAIFHDPLLVDRSYVDGWVYFGWFCVFVLTKKVKEHAFILIPVIAYFIIYALGIPNEPSHGWYRYPFLPFLTIATSIILLKEFKAVTLRSIFFVLVVGLTLLSNAWEHKLGFSYTVMRAFIIFSSLSIFLPLWIKKYEKYSKIFIGLWIIIFVLANILATRVFQG